MAPGAGTRCAEHSRRPATTVAQSCAFYRLVCAASTNPVDHAGAYPGMILRILPPLSMYAAIFVMNSGPPIGSSPCIRIEPRQIVH